jgi:hypothetical protein
VPSDELVHGERQRVLHRGQTVYGRHRAFGAVAAFQRQDAILGRRHLVVVAAGAAAEDQALAVAVALGRVDAQRGADVGAALLGPLRRGLGPVLVGVQP